MKGHVDIVVCNAAVLFFAHTLELTDEEIRRAFDVNVMGTLNVLFFRSFFAEYPLY